MFDVKAGQNKMSLETKFKDMNHQMVLNNVLLKYVDIMDIKDVHKLRTDPDVGKFLMRSLDQSLEEIQIFVEDRMRIDEFFIIRTKDTNEFAGTIALWRIDLDNQYAELGYEMLPEFQGKGLMDSALKLILKHAASLHINRIEAKTHRDNLKSRKLVQRNGFTLLEDVTDDNYLDNVVYEYINANNKT